jgi:ribosomal protein S18 acetylase RimI-like enzyme
LPGERIADAYLAWLQQEAAENGVVLVAECAGLFIGFIAGWIVGEHSITETTDSRRASYMSDICITPAHRGHRIAADLLPEPWKNTS